MKYSELELEQRIEKALLNSKFSRVELLRDKDGDIVVDQLNGKLVFISPNRAYLYILSYEENYNGTNLKGENVALGDFIFRIERVIDRNSEGLQFYQRIMKTKDPININAYKLYLNGKMIMEDITLNYTKYMVRYIKDAMHTPKHAEYEKYKHTRVVTVEDYTRKRTDHVLNDKGVKYNTKVAKIK